MPGTFPNGSASNSFNTAFPLDQNPLIFDLTITCGNPSETDIENVPFLSVISGDGTIPGDHNQNGVPEPAAFLVVGVGVAALGWYGRRTRPAA